MTITQDRLQDLVETLCSRPGHEMVRSLVHELCVVGLDVPRSEVNFEVPVPEVQGRLDALFGSTVFEFKRDLRRESEDAESQLTRYLGQRERTSHRRYLGIATDGADFVAYELNDGRLVRLDEHIPSSADPRALLRWLDTAITVRADLPPDPITIRAEFGRESLVFRRSVQQLREMWDETRSIPEARLKHELWSRHLEFVYGTLIKPDELFLQHTYLTIVAKTMAVRVLVRGPVPPNELLAGTPFTQIGLNGAVETDFFDWVLLADGGGELVDRIAGQVARFRLTEIEVDVLKGLYESLIDPRQRHYLGEYYTPDWLAEWMCREAVPEPLNTRVLDPACGSGTFLFYSVRRYLLAAEREGRSLQRSLEGCTDHVFGLDVHPVAVLFARVTYLLAIGSDRLRNRTGPVSVPVYLGDALQWDVRQFLTEEEVEIAVPDETPLRFPGSVAGDPNLLDAVLRAMRQLADERASSAAFRAWLNTNTSLSEPDREILVESYEHMRALHTSGRDHIWTYIVRNLTRPLWLSLRRGKPDTVIGNPPWLRFNAMSRFLQQRFKEASRARGLWVGGKVATQQDLSAYFFARAVERYLSIGGKISFVMPLASLSRHQYEGFRRGRYGTPGRRGQVAATVQFDQVWTFDSDVSPLFPVPAAVVFAHRDVTTGSLPEIVVAFHGALPRRDATPEEARRALQRNTQPWPVAVVTEGGSPYRGRFRQGATIVPRRLMMVTTIEAGRFGGDPNMPLVASREGAQDKEPWRSLPALRGQIEREFLRPVLLGESIAPYRVLSSALGIIPWDHSLPCVLDSETALSSGRPHLARWLRRAEELWDKHGRGRMTLTQRLDYHRGMSQQFPIAPIRVVYAASGSNPAAAVIRGVGLIEHSLYYAIVETNAEAAYLVAILNSEAARAMIAGMQARGQFGARHFDKLIFNLPIPRFSTTNRLHRDLAGMALRAERMAAHVELHEGQSFQVARKKIRNALKEANIANSVDQLVSQLLNAAVRVPA